MRNEANQPADTLQPWDRQPSETDASWAAFCDYRDMGVRRSLRSLLDHYGSQAANDPLTRPPTLRWPTLSGWSSKYEWQQRVKSWDEHQRALWDAERDARLAAERQRRWKALDRLNEIVMSAQIDLADANAVAKLAGALQRCIVESRRETGDHLEKSLATINATVKRNPQTAEDFAAMSDAELEQIIAMAGSQISNITHGAVESGGALDDDGDDDDESNTGPDTIEVQL